MLAPLVFTSQGLIADATLERQADEVVDEWLGDDPGFLVSDVVAEAEGVTQVTVLVAVTGPDDPHRRATSRRRSPTSSIVA